MRFVCFSKLNQTEEEQSVTICEICEKELRKNKSAIICAICEKEFRVESVKLKGSFKV